MKKKITAIAIDDETQSLEFLNKLVKNYFNNEIEILHCYTDLAIALNFLTENVPDIIFLDIEMPQMNGFDFFKLLPEGHKSKFVVISGKEDFALKALKLSFFDYLTKPISLIDLRNCIEKFKKHQAETVRFEDNATIVVNRQDKAIFIEINHIYYIEASGPYCNIVYDGKKIATTKSISYFEDKLNSNQFYRIHRSYLINIKQIKEVVKNEGNGIIILSDNSKLPISKEKKDDFLRLFNK